MILQKFIAVAMILALGSLVFNGLIQGLKMLFPNDNKFKRIDVWIDLTDSYNLSANKITIRKKVDMLKRKYKLSNMDAILCYYAHKNHDKLTFVKILDNKTFKGQIY